MWVLASRRAPGSARHIPRAREGECLRPELPGGSRQLPAARGTPLEQGMVSAPTPSSRLPGAPSTSLEQGMVSASAPSSREAPGSARHILRARDGECLRPELPGGSRQLAAARGTS